MVIKLFNLKNGKDGIEERGYSGFQMNLGCIWKCMKIFIISIYESNVCKWCKLNVSVHLFNCD